MKRIDHNLYAHQTFRLSEEEKEKLHNYAEQHNLTVTEVLRNFVATLDAPNVYEKILYGGSNVEAMTKLYHVADRTKWVHIATEKTMIFYLSNIANNINQIARWANTYKDRADADKVVEMLKNTARLFEPTKKAVALSVKNEKLKKKKIIEEYVEDVHHEDFKQGKLQGAYKLLTEWQSARHRNN